MSLICSIACFSALQDTGGPHVLALADEARILGEQANINVSVSKELGGLRVFVRRGEADPQFLIARLADLAGASLVKTSAGIEIVRTRQDLTSLEKRRDERGKRVLLQFFRNWDENQKSLSRLGSPEEQAKHVLLLDEEVFKSLKLHPGLRTDSEGLPIDPVMPAGRLARRLVSKIDLSHLADLRDSELRIFSNAPVGDEVMLPKSDAELEQFSVERKALSDTGIEHAVAERGLLRLPARDGTKPLPPPDSLRIVMAASQSHGEYTFRASIYSQDGTLIDSGACGTQMQFVVDDGRWLVRDAERNRDSVWENLSSSGKAWRDIFDRSRDRSASIHRDGSSASSRLKALADVFSRQAVGEPLDGYVRDAILAISNENRSKPFVAIIPDSLFGSIPKCIDKDRLSLDALEATLKREHISITEKSDIIEFCPEDVEQPTRINGDRKSIIEFEKSVLRQGCVDLRAAALLAHDCPGAVGTFWLNLAASAIPTILPSDDSRILELLGSLSDSEYASLSEGEPTYAGSPSGKESLRRLLIGRDVRNKIVSSAAISDLVRDYTSELVVNADYSRIPLSLNVSESRVLQISNKEPKLNLFESVYQIATRIGQRARRIVNQSMPVAGAAPSVEKLVASALNQPGLRVITAHRITYQLYIGSRTGLHKEVSFTLDTNPSSKSTTFEDVDADLRETIYNLAVKIAKS